VYFATLLEQLEAFKQIKSLLAAAETRLHYNWPAPYNLIKNTRSAALHSIRSGKVCFIRWLAANKSIASAPAQLALLMLFLHASMGLLPPVGVK
jgi:hypothetical protein